MSWPRSATLVGRVTGVLVFGFLGLGVLFSLGLLIVAEVPFRLGVGWLAHGGRLVEHVEVRVASVVTAAVLLVGGLFAVHAFARWLAASRTAAGRPGAWRLRWTLLGGGLFVFGAAASVSTLCLAHQVGWLAREDSVSWSGRPGRTKSTLTWLGISLEEHRRRLGHYPVEVELAPVHRLSGDLWPDARVTPRATSDAWRRPILYCSDATGERYRLVSLGADGVAGARVDRWLTLPSDDIVRDGGAS